MAKFTQEDIRLAQETQAKYGVPASVTLAQYALESGYGSTYLANKANNYFGISGKNVNTGEYVMSSGRRWAKYTSKAESFDDHGRLLSTDLYASKTAGVTSAGAYIDAIAETYAPSSDGNSGYAAQLKQIISQNNLTQYDRGVFGGNGGSTGGSGDRGTFGGSGGVVDGSSTIDTSEESGVLGKAVKFVALMLVAILAAVFFFSAFNISMNPKNAIKKAVSENV